MTEPWKNLNLRKEIPRQTDDRIVKEEEVVLDTAAILKFFRQRDKCNLGVFSSEC